MAVNSESSDDKILHVDVRMIDVEWDEVTMLYPPLSMIPTQVASLYTTPPDDATAMTVEEIQIDVAVRVKQGTILLCKVLKVENILALYQRFNICLGVAIGSLISKMQESEESDGIVRYTSERLCGEFFAHIALEFHCAEIQNEHEVPDDAIDPVTGFLKNLEMPSLLIILESVLNCVQLPDSFKKEVRSRSIHCLQGYVFLLSESNDLTTWH